MKLTNPSVGEQLVCVLGSGCQNSVGHIRSRVLNRTIEFPPVRPAPSLDRIGADALAYRILDRTIKDEMALLDHVICSRLRPVFADIATWIFRTGIQRTARAKKDERKNRKN
jgi:hypothetical protein